MQRNGWTFEPRGQYWYRWVYWVCFYEHSWGTVVRNLTLLKARPK